MGNHHSVDVTVFKHVTQFFVFLLFHQKIYVNLVYPKNSNINKYDFPLSSLKQLQINDLPHYMENINLISNTLEKEISNKLRTKSPHKRQRCL